MSPVWVLQLLSLSAGIACTGCIDKAKRSSYDIRRNEKYDLPGITGIDGRIAKILGEAQLTRMWGRDASGPRRSWRYRDLRVYWQDDKSVNIFALCTPIQDQVMQGVGAQTSSELHLSYDLFHGQPIAVNFGRQPELIGMFEARDDIKRIIASLPAVEPRTLEERDAADDRVNFGFSIKNSLSDNPIDEWVFQSGCQADVSGFHLWASFKHSNLTILLSYDGNGDLKDYGVSAW